VREEYSLTLHNQTGQSNLSFAVYAVAPVSETTSVYPLAWQARRVNAGNHVTFNWWLSYSLMFGTSRCLEGTVWTESGSIPVADDDRDRNSAQLDCPNDDYKLSLTPGQHEVEPGHVYLDTTADVSEWFKDGPSVGLGILSGRGSWVPVIVGDSGPNLHHRFDLHPAYYIDAGRIQQGVMTDMATVTDHQQVIFDPGVYSVEWTLNESITWTSGGPGN
jgi:hypothetical protein